MPDQARLGQLGEGTEVLCDLVRAAVAAQVHHVQVVSAELAQIFVDLAAQLVRAGSGEPLAGGGRPGLGTLTRPATLLAFELGLQGAASVKQPDRAVDVLVGGVSAGQPGAQQ